MTKSILSLARAFVGSYVGTTLGIITMFTIATYGGERFFKRKGHSKSLTRYYHYVDKYGQWFLIALLILPILPDEVIALGAGFSRMSYKKFIPIALFAKLITSYTLSYLPVLFV